MAGLTTEQYCPSDQEYANPMPLGVPVLATDLKIHNVILFQSVKIMVAITLLHLCFFFFGGGVYKIKYGQFSFLPQLLRQAKWFNNGRFSPQ